MEDINITPSESARLEQIEAEVRKHYPDVCAMLIITNNGAEWDCFGRGAPSVEKQLTRLMDIVPDVFC